jgi:ubiquinone/menaquinone biosynthesis C-methylase UbiE
VEKPFDMAAEAPNKWPKTISPLTDDQKAISDDFMKRWHEILPRYGLVEKFNHGWVVETAPASFTTTLEIGAGLGEHLSYERLTPAQESSYVALDVRDNMATELRRRYPLIQVLVADCQQQLAFADNFFDRIVAVHVLEHLPDLPNAISELYRLCNKSSGVLQAVIPCEGSAAYTICRRISAQRVFEKRYKQSYRWFVEREHINLPHEILIELGRYFIVEQRAFFPIPLPFVWCNLCIGLRLRPRVR